MTGNRGKTRLYQRLMPDSRLRGAERAVHRRFSFGKRIPLIFLLFLVLLLTGDRNWEKLNRTPRQDATAAIFYRPLPIPAPQRGQVAMSGLWEIVGSDPRLGGLSGLASQEGGLLAVSDAGALVRLPKPGEGTVATFRDLPSGPGSPYWKKFRDAESLTRDPAGRGWWVGFEFQHSLYLFDENWARALQRTSFPEERWAPNESLEVLVPEGSALLLIPETGTEVLRRAPAGRIEVVPLTGATGEPADAARLPDGRVVVLLRAVRPWGIANQLAWLVKAQAGYRLMPFATVPLGAFDNLEGVTAEQRPGGGTRLWLVTDNDFSTRRRTLLVAVDLPRARRPASSPRP